MQMHNEKGVTITSLTIYIIVSVVVLASLAFLNINVISQVAALSKKSEKTNEILKVQTNLVKDIKSAGRVLEFSDKHIRFDNNVEYNIKYRSNQQSNSQTFDVYELYRGNELITDKMSNISFDYGTSGSEEYIVFNILDEDYAGGEIFVKVGRGY